MTNFKWVWCHECRWATIICPKCGQNCCGVDNGKLPDGSECDICPSAYRYQEDAYEAGTDPKTPEEVEMVNLKNR